MSNCSIKVSKGVGQTLNAVFFPNAQHIEWQDGKQPTTDDKTGSVVGEPNAVVHAEEKTLDSFSSNEMVQRSICDANPSNGSEIHWPSYSCNGPK